MFFSSQVPIWHTEYVNILRLYVNFSAHQKQFEPAPKNHNRFCGRLVTSFLFPRESGNLFSPFVWFLSTILVSCFAWCVLQNCENKSVNYVMFWKEKLNKCLDTVQTMYYQVYGMIRAVKDHPVTASLSLVVIKKVKGTIQCTIYLKIVKTQKCIGLYSLEK